MMKKTFATPELRPLLALLALFLVTMVTGQSAADGVSAGNSNFFNLSGTLDPGELITPGYFLSEGTRPFNFSLSAMGGSPLEFQIEDSDDNVVWSGDVLSGETRWGTGTLTAGNNRLLLFNPTAATISFDLTLFDLPAAPMAVSGTARAGAPSSIRLNFPTDALYAFDLDVGHGSYQLQLGNDYILKTAVSDTAATYFIPAGEHTLTVWPDAGAGAGWRVDVGAAGPSADTLPLAHSGGGLGGLGNGFVDEWLVVHLAEATEVNINLQASGGYADTFNVQIYPAGSPNPIFVRNEIYGSEATWGKVLLPAGTSRIHIAARLSNATSLGYLVGLSAIPIDNAAWSGAARDSSYPAFFRVAIAASGLYRLTIGSTTGFANIVLDGTLLEAGERLPLGAAGYAVDVIISQGMHDITILHDPAFPATVWDASLAPAVPGESFFTFSGTIGPGETVQPFYELNATTFDANLLVTAAGGGPVEVDMRNGEGQTVWSGSVRSSEMLWKAATLSEGRNTISLTNVGTTPAQANLSLYPVAGPGFPWDGNSIAGGGGSAMWIDIPADGVYNVNLGVAGNGRYHFSLDENDVRRTVTQFETLQAWIRAGRHRLAIDTDPATGANWSLVLQPSSVTSTTLPFTAAGEDLGGAGNPFSEERHSLHLTEATALNLSAAITGDNGDTATFVLHDQSGQPIVTLPNLVGGETSWQTLDLPAGTTYIHIVTPDGNVNPIDYAVTLAPPAGSGETFAGRIFGDDLNSEVRVILEEAGRYELELGHSGGAYQVRVDDTYLWRTVNAPAASTYWLDAGSHRLGIVPGDASPTDWSLSLTRQGGAPDPLPLEHSSDLLGGPDNRFNEEWLPLTLSAPAAANIRLAVAGAPDDRLTLSLVDDTGATVGAIAPVFSDETTWTTVDIPAGTTRLHLASAPSNSAVLRYELSVSPLPAIRGLQSDHRFIWTGQSAAEGSSAAVRFKAEIAGIYLVSVYLPDGFTNIVVDPAPLDRPLLPEYGAVPADIYYDFEVALDAEEHTLFSDHDPYHPITSWHVTTTLITAAPPTLTSVYPARVTAGELTTVTLHGFNLMPKSGVQLRAGETAVAAAVSYQSGSRLQLAIPAETPLGVYDIVVVNPDGQEATLALALTVHEYRGYLLLPVISRP